MWHAALLPLLAFGQPAKPPPALIQQVRFKGERASALKDVKLKTKRGAKLDPKLLRADIRALWSLGRYSDIRAFSTVVRKGRVRVLFELSPHPKLGKFSIEAKSGPVTNQALQKAAALKSGETLSTQRLHQVRASIRNLYRAQGHLNAKVKPVLNTRNKLADLRLEVDPGPLVTIRAIELDGAQKLSAVTLQNLMETKPRRLISLFTGSGLLDRERLEADVLKLTAAYFDHGYVNVKVQKPQLVPVEEGRAIDIRIQIEEGPQFKLGKIKLTGALPLPEDKLREKLKSREGQIFSRSHIGGDIALLRAMWSERGVANATVTPQTRIEGQTIHLTFQVGEN